MFIPFFLGVLMTLCGFALLVVGEARLGKRRIRKAWARRLGVFLVAFFPVILIERLLLKELDAEESVDPLHVHLGLTGFWALSALVLFLKAIRRTPRPRVSVSLKTEAPAGLESDPYPPMDFSAPEPITPAKPSPGRKKKDTPPSPFDF